MPPIRLDELRAAASVSDDVSAELDDLLALKAVSNEIDGVGRYAGLDRYIDEMIAHGRRMANAAPNEQPNIDALNALFRSLT